MDWILVICNTNQDAKPFEKLMLSKNGNNIKIMQRYYLLEANYYNLAYSYFFKEKNPNTIQLYFSTSIYNYLIPKSIKEELGKKNEWDDEKWKKMKKQKVELLISLLKNV